MNLSGKRILFIAPKFFGYERVIVEALESAGASVTYASDRPSDGFATKALIRVNRKLLARKVNRYYDSIIDATSQHDFDEILIVRGEAISRERLRRLRSKHPRARASLYLWDSMHYNPNARNILAEFDKRFSFDRFDADNEKDVEFLPLFYGSAFEESAKHRGEFLHDACFIGTIHTDRYKILERIIASLRESGKSLDIFCYYPSRTLYQLRSLVDPGFRQFGKTYVNFDGIPLTEVVERISVSRVVIDINRPSQRGLTMRTIEALGAQRKLLTTNTDVVNYDLYDPSAIAVIDREHPEVPEEFFTDERAPFDPDVRARYSLEAWVLAVFGSHPTV